MHARRGTRLLLREGGVDPLRLRRRLHEFVQRAQLRLRRRRPQLRAGHDARRVRRGCAAAASAFVPWSRLDQATQPQRAPHVTWPSEDDSGSGTDTSTSDEEGGAATARVAGARKLSPPRTHRGRAPAAGSCWSARIALCRRYNKAERRAGRVFFIFFFFFSFRTIARSVESFEGTSSLRTCERYILPRCAAASSGAELSSSLVWLHYVSLLE